MSTSETSRVLLTFFHIILCLSFTLVSIPSIAFVNVIKIPKPRSEYDISHDYHKKLLHMALKRAANVREIPSIVDTTTMSQGRAIVELKKGNNLDVYWLGASTELDDDLLAIKVPTTRGLIGYRKFIIHRNSIAAFDTIKTIDDLKKFSACQGTHWPDTKILRAADLKVTTSTNYEDIFNMLAHKRCDYFPRAFHDSVTELELREKMFPDLVNYQQIILHYPFAVYFYTSKNNKDLAYWIEEGLTQLAENGEIENLMKQHPLTANVFPFKDEKESVFIELTNGFLNLEGSEKNSTYWILPKDFNLATFEE